MHLLFNGTCGKPPEAGSDEHLFLVACTSEVPELWEYFNSMKDEEVDCIVGELQRMGWGFSFVTLH